MGKEKKEERVLVGFSGGLDSTLTLYLLKEKGFTPIALTLKFLPQHDKRWVEFAEKIAQKVGVKIYFWDLSSEFREIVVKYFLEKTGQLKTPNPCVICNRYFKFNFLFSFAKKLGIKKIATGHYAKILFKEGEFFLSRAKWSKKDQSYFLLLLKKNWLENMFFPLGSLSSRKIGLLVERYRLNDLNFTSSQDLCFLAGEGKENFLKRRGLLKEGLIISDDGSILGSHKGLPLYTLGQRKGLGLAGGPYFVVGFDKKRNYLRVSKNKRSLYRREVVIGKVNLLVGSSYFEKYFRNNKSVKVKLRHKMKLRKAFLKKMEKNRLLISFKQSVFAPALGQFAAIYSQDGKILLGGGEILDSK